MKFHVSSFTVPWKCIFDLSRSIFNNSLVKLPFFSAIAVAAFGSSDRMGGRQGRGGGEERRQGREGGEEREQGREVEQN